MELSYLTTFFEGRQVVETQFDRDASRRFAGFIYNFNSHVFLQKRDIAFTPVNELDILRLQTVSCATV